uniref:Uncharacterized protein n=1 Tax=viral metagenome TaxID=1070528 RepID=A0A6C0LGH3_9ZZZZ
MYPSNIHQVHDTYSKYTEHINKPVFDCFENKKERRKFIRKTFGLFLLSILSTLGSCLAFKYVDGTTNFVKSEVGQALTVISLLTTLITIFITICYDSLLRKSYIKYMIYVLFTFGISWSIGILAIYIKNNILISAILITTGTTTTLILYSLVTTSDFTGYTEYYIVGLVAIILTGTINIFLQNSIFQLLITGFVCLLFSFIIIYDVQMIVAQKHIKYKFSLDDSILAAMSLYIDTVNLFIYIFDF